MTYIIVLHYKFITILDVAAEQNYWFQYAILILFLIFHYFFKWNESGIYLNLNQEHHII